MKKIYSLLVLALCCIGSVNAQNVKFLLDGKEVKDGEILIFSAIKNPELLPFGVKELSAYTSSPLGGTGSLLEIKNTGSTAAEISVTIDKVGEIDKSITNVSWCGLSEKCEDYKGTAMTRTATVAGGENAKNNLQLDAIFTEDTFAECTFKVDMTEAGTTTTIYVKFVYDALSGIQGVSAEASTAKAIDGGISINGGSWTVYDLTGKSIAAGYGAKSIQLPVGVYIVRIDKSAKKFIVR